MTVEDSTPGDTLAVTGSAALGDFTITSSHGTAMAFATPPSGLTIQAGADGAVDFSGVTDLQGGNLTVSAGSIQVDGTLTSHGGVIDLDAGARARCSSREPSTSRTPKADTLAGSVELLGDRVGLLDDAPVDASGDAGGGECAVGGDYHGANAAIRNASYVYVKSRFA